MSTPIWITIAAIILPLISSWIQFLVKEHRDRKRALATANPATNQPKSAEAPKSASTLFKRHWLFLVAIWALSAASLEIGVSLLRGSIPANFNTVLALIYSLIALVLVTILFMRAK